MLRAEERLEMQGRQSLVPLIDWKQNYDANAVIRQLTVVAILW